VSRFVFEIAAKFSVDKKKLTCSRSEVTDTNAIPLLSPRIARLYFGMSQAGRSKVY